MDPPLLSQSTRAGHCHHPRLVQPPLLHLRCKAARDETMGPIFTWGSRGTQNGLSSRALLCGALARPTEAIFKHAHPVSAEPLQLVVRRRMPSPACAPSEGPRDPNILSQVGNQAVLFSWGRGATTSRPHRGRALCQGTEPGVRRAGLRSRPVTPSKSFPVPS